jgi:hypothetical protein
MAEENASRENASRELPYRHSLCHTEDLDLVAKARHQRCKTSLMLIFLSACDTCVCVYTGALSIGYTMNETRIATSAAEVQDAMRILATEITPFYCCFYIKTFNLFHGSQL